VGPTLFVLVGATAAGKSAAAIEVARILEAEIVSLDSMLLYRGMDIGTDKPRNRAGIRHHLIDLLDPSERFDLERYIELADAAIEEIGSRGRRVLVAGGTGLYLMGLLKGVFSGAPRDAELRAGLAGLSAEELYRRVERVDPELAARIHPHDRRRAIRALEVFERTGRALSELQRQFTGPDRYPAVIAGLELPRAILKRRIEERVDAMLRRGLVEEVRGLSSRLGPTASQAVGYKEVLGFLRGRYDRSEARRLIVRNSVRLARRQSTWFKRFPVVWADGTAPDRVARLLEIYRGKTTA